jgi:hypothetical protein
MAVLGRGGSAPAWSRSSRCALARGADAKAETPLWTRRGFFDAVIGRSPNSSGSGWLALLMLAMISFTSCRSS